MNLIDLVVLACTLANPVSCREFHILFQSGESLKSCAIHAEPYLARWVGEHPAYRVVRWHCAWPEREDQNI